MNKRKPVQKPKFSRHPLTGEPIVPIGFLPTGRAVWPIMGGDDTIEPGEGASEEGLAALDALVKIGDKTHKVEDLTRIMANEKRQGKRSGIAEALAELGFDSLEDAKAALEAKTTPTPKAPAAPADGGNDDAAAAIAAAAERERKAAEREAKAAAVTRKAELRAALAGTGVPRAALDDAVVLLNAQVPSDYDVDELEDAVVELQKRHPAMFEQKKPPAAPAPTLTLPKGRPGDTGTPKTAVFGADGVARAKRMFNLKD